MGVSVAACAAPDDAWVVLVVGMQVVVWEHVEHWVRACRVVGYGHAVEGGWVGDEGHGVVVESARGAGGYVAWREGEVAVASCVGAGG